MSGHTVVTRYYQARVWSQLDMHNLLTFHPWQVCIVCGARSSATLTSVCPGPKPARKDKP